MKATELINPTYVISMHYDTFPAIAADSNEFKELTEVKTAAKVKIVQPGESVVL